MSPTLKHGDGILISRLDKQYARGDIILFKMPDKPNYQVLSRIVGLPGEKIQITGNKILIQDQPLNEDYLANQIDLIYSKEGEWKLGDKEFFVLGDNRSKSIDSREFGPIEKSQIVGHFLYLLSHK